MATTSSKTDRSDNDRKFVAFGRKILVLVKLMALMIYAKAGLLRPRPRTNISALHQLFYRKISISVPTCKSNPNSNECY